MADHESGSNYRQARSIGKKFVSDNSRMETKGYLPVLDDIIQDVEIVSELNLGIREIPLKKVIGTRTSARSTAFAGNFMPLLAENTEFGIKWKKLYNSHIDEGIRDPIKVYEYINRFFVLEGNKRVSVLKYLDAVSISAKVIRLIPKRDDSNKLVSLYYEFLDFDRRESFDNLWFSHRGMFSRLVSLVESYRAAKGITDSAADIIKRNYKTFRSCYKEANFSDIPITTGDAFLEFLLIYGLDETMSVADIRERVKNCGAQFRLLSLRDEDVINTVEMRHDEEKSALSFFSKRPRKLKVAFAFESTPGQSLWTASHAAAMDRLRRAMGEKIEIVSRDSIPQGEAAYPILSEMMDAEPDILFATSPNMSSAVLRLSLEHPERTILNCDIAQPRKNMMTYFPKLHESAFLCGVLAGAMSRADTVGYMTASRFHTDKTYGVNGFALGARLVNPRVRVVDYIMPDREPTEEDHNKARLQLAQHGVDIAYCIHQLGTPLVRKAFPGVYAQLYLINPRTGLPDECIGAAALNWSVFYNQVVGDSFTTKNSILDITRSGADSAVHFGWGIESGIVDVLGVDAFMGHNATKLMRIFRRIVKDGQARIFEGPLIDREQTVRVEKEDMPTLLEIQNMDWLLDTVATVIHGE